MPRSSAPPCAMKIASQSVFEIAAAGSITAPALGLNRSTSPIVAPAGGDRVAEGLLDDVAIGGLRNHRREFLVSLADGISDDPFDFALRLKAKKIDAVTANAAIGREGQHRHAAVARERRYSIHRGRENRPDDDFRALVQKLLGRSGDFGLRSRIVGRHQQDIAVARNRKAPVARPSARRSPKHGYSPRNP